MTTIYLYDTRDTEQHSNTSAVEENASGTYEEFINSRLISFVVSLKIFQIVLSPFLETTIKEDGMNVSKRIQSEYDGIHRRIRRTVTDYTTPANSYTRKYVYAGSQIIAELDGANNLIASYLHGPGIDAPLMMSRQPPK